MGQREKGLFNSSQTNLLEASEVSTTTPSIVPVKYTRLLLACAKTSGWSFDNEWDT